MSRRRLLALLGLLLALRLAPAAHAEGRPPDATAPCAPIASPRRRRTTRLRDTSACTTSPIRPTATAPRRPRRASGACRTGSSRSASRPRPPGRARRRSAFRRLRPTIRDGAERGGDARYDVYVCDLASHDLGELAATVADPPGSGLSYIVVDNDYAPAEVAPLTTSGVEQLRVTVAHELFHAIQIGEGRGRLPEWLAEASAVWMEGIVAPPDVDREIYRVALGGAGTEAPYWRGGDLHEYGAWWLIAQLERAHPGFVRRLLALAASRGDDDPRGLELLARASGARRALEAAFARFARSALDDPLVGKALRARRTAHCVPAGGSCCGRACSR